MSASKQAMIQQKPVVNYRPSKYGQIEVGLPAVVIALNHPSHLIEPGDEVRTSTVKAYDEVTGDFETRNTFYRLAQE